MATDTTTTESLQNFQFDEGAEWFGIKPGAEGSELKDTIQEIKGEKTEEGATTEKATTLKETNKPEEEDADDEVTFFEDEKPKEKPKKEEDDNEEEEVEVEVKEGKKDKPKEKAKDAADVPEEKFFSTLAGEMKEKGIFQNIEIPKDKDLTEEEFFELQDAEIEARVEETFQEFFTELDEDGKEFLKFKRNGGKTSDFLATYSIGFNIEEFDEADEAQRTKVISHYLSTVEKLDADEIADKMAWLKEGGKEKTTAAKYFTKIKEQEQTQRANLLKAEEDAATARAETAKKFNTELKDVLNKTEAVGSFQITKVEQKELDSYITKPTVKVGKNRYVPSFNADIAKIFKADTPETKQKLILLAKLVKTDFDVKDLITTVETTVTKKAKSKLMEAKQGTKVSSSGIQSKKALGDFFPD